MSNHGRFTICLTRRAGLRWAKSGGEKYHNASKGFHDHDYLDGEGGGGKGREQVLHNGVVFFPTSLRQASRRRGEKLLSLFFPHHIIAKSSDTSETRFFFTPSFYFAERLRERENWQRDIFFHFSSISFFFFFFPKNLTKRDTTKKV